MSSVENEAFVTLATNDVYAIGAVVWAKSLARQKTTRKIVAIITPGVSADMARHIQVGRWGIKVIRWRGGGVCMGLVQDGRTLKDLPPF